MNGRTPTLFAVTIACAAAACGASKASGGEAPASRAGATSGTAGTGAGGTTGSTGGAGPASVSGAGNVGAAGSSGAAPAGAGAGAGAGGGGASGGAAGSGSAGAGVAGASGGAASTNPCSARPGLLFCDDFESATVGAVPAVPWSTTFVGGSSTVTIDSSVPAHSGTKSVLVHPTKDGYQTLLVYHDAAVLPQANGRFFFRAFVRPDQPMSSGHNTLVIGDTFAAPNTGNVTRLGEDNNMLMMTVGGDAHGYNSNPNYYNDHLPGVVFPAQVYTCLEMLFDAPNTEIDVWVNGTEVPGLHVTDLAHENYDMLSFGLEKYAGNDADADAGVPAGDVSDFWYDDIAIGTQQIGCN